MTDLYWVGGTESWNATAGSKWSLTSGGTGGEAVPTSADNVFFDANSGTVVVTVSATANCADLTFTGYTGTLAGSSALNIYGSLTLGSGMTRTYTGTITFSSTSTGKTITSSGITMASSITFNGIGGEWTLQDSLNNGDSSITITRGSFVTNNQNMTCGSFNCSNSNTRSLNLGSSQITIPTLGATWSTSISTNLTFNAGTSTIIMSGELQSFTGGGLTYYNLTVSGEVLQINSSNTFNNITFNSTSTNENRLLFAGNQVVNGTLTLSGFNSTTRRLLVLSNSVTTQRTITAATVSLTNVNFQDIVQAGASIPWTGTSVNYVPDSVGATSEWTSPTNVWRSDNVYASAGAGSSVDEQIYKQFNIPTFTGYGIDGIEVFMEAKDAASSPTSWTVTAKLSSDGGSSWTTTDSQTWSSTSDTIASFGGSTDKWGRGWSSANLTNANFQVMFDVTGGISSADFKIDQVRVQVYVSSGTTTSTSTSTTSSSTSTSSTSTSTSTSTTSSSSSTSTSSTSSSSSTSTTSSSTSSTSTSTTSSSTSTTSSSTSSTSTSTTSSSTSTTSSSTSTTSSSSSTSTTSSSISTSSTSTSSTSSSSSSSSSTSTTQTGTTTTTSSTSSSTSSTSTSSTSTSSTSTSTTSSSSTSTIMYIPDIDMTNDQKPEKHEVSYI